MIFRECKRCGHPMDPGEGQNGMCDDCVTGETERREREEKMEWMIRATDWTQLEALECIINKELYYIGSKYPLCSIVRTRKYLERGYHINAGQYVKMCFQLNELDLKDVKVLEDQLTGVDTTYFKMMVDAIQKHMEETGEERVDATYAMNLINKLF